MQWRSKLLGLLVLAAVGCSSGPKYTVPDESLASLSADEKRDVIAAQAEAEGAKADAAKAATEARNAGAEEDIASNDVKAAKLRLDSAKQGEDLASKSGDLNKKSAAETETKRVQLDVEAAEAKRDWLSRKTDYVKSVQKMAEAAVSAKLARVELAKAKLAASKNIKPSENFSVVDFENEAKNKEQAYADAKSSAEGAKNKADEQEKAFQEKLKASAPK
jgi:hypothetical protein